MRGRVLAAAVFCGVLTAAQAAADPPDVKSFNAHLVATTAGADGVFSAQADGSVRHVQSGLVCPAELPSFHLMDLQIYGAPPDTGADVGCDYARLGKDDAIVSKLTVFFVKAPDGATLDSTFRHYGDEVLAAHPGATATPAALHIGERTDYRAAGYAILEGDRHYHSELLVGLAHGWAVEVRATYASGTIIVTKDTTKQDMADQLHDIENTYVAYMQVMGLN